MNSNIRWLWFLLGLVMVNPAFAEGKAVVGKEKAAACAGCHGDDGNSLVAAFPKLAQQHENYLLAQLRAFKSGARQNSMMNALAGGLSDKDMADLAAFYANQKVSGNPARTLTLDDDEAEELSGPEREAREQALQAEWQQTLAKGRDLYRNGDLKREISACIACHGPYGEGNRPAGFPALRGQHADYLEQSLKDFKAGVRSNNPDNMMHMIAVKMTDQQIQAIAHYLAEMNVR
ncbi:MAG: c-type cytochrome [Methylococcales bacterium]|nr:c-type cytochrome [Methylococcales bacterium]